MNSQTDVSDLVRYLSIERLTTFHTITGSHVEAIKLHQQALQFGASLMTVMAVIEIALRNAICDRLDTHYNGGAWLLSPPPALQWDSAEKNKIIEAQKHARRSMYAKMTQSQKRQLNIIAFPNGIPPNLQTGGQISHLKIVSIAQKHIAVTMGQIVSQLTFFFWKRLYSKDYDQTLWQPLKSIFPDRKLKRADVAAKLEILYQSRNRIAHHEPIYGRRLIETMDAIDFFVANFDGVDAGNIPKITRLLSDDLRQLRSQADDLTIKINSFRVVVDIV